ncbi:hypothetical protein [Vulgatibacter sp.]|uniref:hypothetical protein n=1 Tax=Vulgatibacter sp. TaxID=1971226 RepID=UPI003568AD91
MSRRQPQEASHGLGLLERIELAEAAEESWGGGFRALAVGSGPMALVTPEVADEETWHRLAADQQDRYAGSGGAGRTAGETLEQYGEALSRAAEPVRRVLRGEVFRG